VLTVFFQMVLQQNAASSLYGYSQIAGSTVSVSFKDTVYSASASTTEAVDGGYYWKLTLPPTSGGFEQYTLNITSNAGEHKYLSNVVFGDVFFCSGQSNMQFGVPGMVCRIPFIITIPLSEICRDFQCYRGNHGR
jgi:sialate O-acetylesterase